jgi:hypothetical protein
MVFKRFEGTFYSHLQNINDLKSNSVVETLICLPDKLRLLTVRQQAKLHDAIGNETYTTFGFQMHRSTY